jgi:predicted MPP superfamily phosphohydrolase
LPSKKNIKTFALVLGVFTAFNLLTLSAGAAIFPGQFQWFLFFGALGNLLWFFVPKIFRRRTTKALRWIRALLGPPWFLWTLFLVLFCLFLLPATFAWILRTYWAPVPFGTFMRPVMTVYLMVLGVIWIVGMVQALVGWHVARVAVPLAKLPKAFHGFKIAMLSDLHVGLFTRPARLRQFIRIALENQPDLIVIAGDITDDNSYYIPKFLRSLKQVRSPIPMVAILGNHDMYGGPREIMRELKESPLRILVNQGFALKRGKASLWIAGLSDYAAKHFERMEDLSPDLSRCLRGKPKGAVTVLLAHQPHAFEEAVKRKVELTLSGHTHGGQLGLRFLDWSLAKTFTTWHMGHFKREGSQLYVTVGTGFWMVPFRFGLPPEISLLELRHK